MAKAYRDGKHYRERAEECRAIAEILATVDLREQMQKIADDYERMAVIADNARKTVDEADLQKVR
jgi:hypothetical protein